MEYKVRNWTRGGGVRCVTLEEAVASLQPPLIRDDDEWEILRYDTPTALASIVALGRGPISPSAALELVPEADALNQQ